jgi:hypothetical protein
LADETIGVLDGSALPGRIRVSEEEIGIKIRSDPLVGPELETVIGGNGENVVFEGSEHPRDRVGKSIGRAIVEFFEQRPSRFSLDKR